MTKPDTWQLDDWLGIHQTSFDAIYDAFQVPEGFSRHPILDLRECFWSPLGSLKVYTCKSLEDRSVTTYFYLDAPEYHAEGMTSCLLYTLDGIRLAIFAATKKIALDQLPGWG